MPHGQSSPSSQSTADVDRPGKADVPERFLVNLARAGEVDALKRFELPTEYPLSESALLAAAQEGHLHVFEWLERERNVTFDKPILEDGRTLAHVASAADRPDILKYLVDKGHGAVLWTEDYHGSTPMDSAVAGGSSAALSYLIDAARETDRPFDFTNIVRTAAECGRTSALRCFHEKGVDVTARDTTGRTPLEYALLKGYGGTAEFLLQEDVRPRDQRQLETYRSRALDVVCRVRTSSEATARPVIESFGNNAATVLLQTGQGEGHFRKKSAVDRALDAGNTGALRAMSHYVWLGTASDRGTLTHRAAAAGDVGVLTLLRDKEVCLNSVDIDGNTPTHLAAKNGDLAVLQFFLENGVSPRDANLKGELPWQLAPAHLKERIREVSEAAPDPGQRLQRHPLAEQAILTHQERLRETAGLTQGWLADVSSSYIHGGKTLSPAHGHSNGAGDASRLVAKQLTCLENTLHEEARRLERREIPAAEITMQLQHLIEQRHSLARAQAQAAIRHSPTAHSAAPETQSSSSSSIPVHRSNSLVPQGGPAIQVMGEGAPRAAAMPATPPPAARPDRTPCCAVQ